MRCLATFCGAQEAGDVVLETISRFSRWLRTNGDGLLNLDLLVRGKSWTGAGNLTLLRSLTLGSPLFDRDYLVQSVLEENAFQDITLQFGD